jgi:hypothetical protein
MLLWAGAGLAAGAVGLTLLSPHFNPSVLAVDLGAIGLGLLMGKGLGMFIFRRVPTAGRGSK